MICSSRALRFVFGETIWADEEFATSARSGIEHLKFIVLLQQEKTARCKRKFVALIESRSSGREFAPSVVKFEPTYVGCYRPRNQRRILRRNARWLLSKSVVGGREFAHLSCYGADLRPLLRFGGVERIPEIVDVQIYNLLFLRSQRMKGNVRLKSKLGDWKVARTRRLESLRYVAQTFLSAGFGDFPVPVRESQLSQFRGWDRATGKSPALAGWKACAT